MSRINGEKARASIERRNRAARRVKDRAALAAIRQSNADAKPAADQPKAESESK